MNVLERIRQLFGEQTVLERIKKLAEKHEWKEWAFQPNERMISFCRWTLDTDDRLISQRINCFYTTMTVATIITHPKKGKTQLFRRNISLKELEEIFIDPRVHSGKGYYERRKG